MHKRWSCGHLLFFFDHFGYVFHIKYVYLQFKSNPQKMKKVLFFFFVFSTLLAAAQNKGTVETRALMQAFDRAKSVDKISKSLLDRYPIRYDREGNASIGATAKVNDSFDAAALESMGIKVTSRVASIVAMNIPLDKLALLQTVPGIESFSVAHRVAPMMDNAKMDTRTDSVNAGLGLPMPFDGEGVLIGITDWGFDYTHPNLNRRNNPRIERVWDHFKTSGPAPVGFNYGTEYTTAQEIYDAKCDTSNLYGYGYHGTHVAGICGGLGTSTGHYVGQAPGAHYLMGTFLLDEVSWMDQVAWMKKYAQQVGKRLVINSSWGMYTFSTLDGTSHVSQAIDAWADSGIVFVTSAGNNGDAKFHLRHTFGTDDTIRSIASYLSSGIGQALIYWGEPSSGNNYSNQFKAAFALQNTSTGKMSVSPFYNTDDDNGYIESVLITKDGDTVAYDIMVEQSNPLDSRPHILLNVSKNSHYRLIMICTADSGVMVNVWNMGNVSNNAGNTGTDFQGNSNFGCIGGDNEYGVSEPGCAEKNITVAAHASDYYVDSTYVFGNIAYFSSIGPILDGRNKPEISAPGYGVISSLSSYRDHDNNNGVYTDRVNGRNYIWASLSGTSMSSPNVTGIVALMLQANPNLTTDQIRDILFSTARNDRFTGPIQERDSISPVWGYGKADAMRAVSAAYDLLSIEEAAVVRPKLVVFPSPATDRVTILTGSNRTQQASIFSVDGRCMMQFTVNAESTVDISALPKGVYYIHIQDRAGVRTAKMIKN